MKSSIEKMDGLFRRVNIEVPADGVSSAFDRVYKEIQKKANIKGFRQGKAPLATIKSLYGNQVQQDVINDLISLNYGKAIEEHKVTPLGQPSIRLEEFAEDKGFKFSAEFEVRPEIQLKKIEKLNIEKEKIKVGDEQMQQVLENIRANHADLVPVFEDRPAQEGDVAIIDFEGFIDGLPLPNGKGENHPLEIGAKQFIEGFEEGMIGTKAGQNKELRLAFPADYHAKDVAGKNVVFQVTLKELKKKSLPELNDELAQKAGPFQSIDELKAAIRKDITDGEENRIQDDLKKRLLEELVKNNPVDVPATLKSEQKLMIIEDVKQRMTQQGMSLTEFEDYKVKWDGEFENTARFMIQSTFLVDEIATQHNLRAGPQEVEGKIAEFSEKTGIELSKVREYYKDADRRSRLAFQMTEEAVVKFLLDKADVKEVEKKESAAEA